MGAASCNNSIDATCFVSLSRKSPVPFILPVILSDRLIFVDSSLALEIVVHDLVLCLLDVSFVLSACILELVVTLVIGVATVSEISSFLISGVLLCFPRLFLALSLLLLMSSFLGEGFGVRFLSANSPDFLDLLASLGDLRLGDSLLGLRASFWVSGSSAIVSSITGFVATSSEKF